MRGDYLVVEGFHIVFAPGSEQNPRFAASGPTVLLCLGTISC